MPSTDDAEEAEPRQDEELADDESETRHERLNRELDQLLNELRVVLPGVQVLLAFLLTAVFATGFDRMDDDGRAVYLTAVVLTALATIFLMAPTMHHRLRFREGVKEQMIRTVNRLTIVGMSMLGVAIGCVLYVVGDVGFRYTAARWLGPALIVVAVVVWFVVPLRYRDGGSVVERRRRKAQSGRADHAGP